MHLGAWLPSLNTALSCLARHLVYCPLWALCLAGNALPCGLHCRSAACVPGTNQTTALQAIEADPEVRLYWVLGLGLTAHHDGIPVP